MAACPSGTAEGGSRYNSYERYCSTSRCNDRYGGVISSCTYQMKAPMYVACYDIKTGAKIGDYYEYDGWIAECCGCD